MTPFERLCSYFLSYSVYLGSQLLCFSENIRSITDLVEPEDDCRTITAVHDRIDKETTGRRKELEKAHTNLKGSLYWTFTSSIWSHASILALARVLDAARTSSTRPPSVPSADRHAENLNHLDGARLSLAKALNDAESAVASKQAELTRLKEQLRQLEESDPAAEHELDGTP